MRNNSVLAGRAFGCSTRDTQILVNCLKSRSATDFTTTEVKPEVGWLTWTPVMDKYTRSWGSQFMNDSPEELLSRKEIKFDADFAYMSGITKNEGSFNVCKYYSFIFVLLSNIVFSSPHRKIPESKL